MIEKKNMLIITFRTTTEAMKMERSCKENAAPGRLIPVPKSISAGCGMAWCVLPEYENVIMQVIKENGICPQEVEICLI